MTNVIINIMINVIKNIMLHLLFMVSVVLIFLGFLEFHSKICDKMLFVENTVVALIVKVDSTSVP